MGKLLQVMAIASLIFVSMKISGYTFGVYRFLGLLAVGLILAWAYVRYEKQVRLLIGETHTHRSSGHARVLVLVIVVIYAPMALLTLLGDRVGTISSVAPLNLVLVAPTLGGLIIAASSARGTSAQMWPVAQKFIAATFLFVVFAPSLLMVDLMGGVDLDVPEVSLAGAGRALYFWIATVTFFLGIAFFIVGLVDLLFALPEQMPGPDKGSLPKESP